MAYVQIDGLSLPQSLLGGPEVQLVSIESDASPPEWDVSQWQDPPPSILSDCPPVPVHIPRPCESYNVSALIKARTD